MGVSNSDTESGSMDTLLGHEEEYVDYETRKTQRQRWWISDCLHWALHTLTILLVVGLYLRRWPASSTNDIHLYTPAIEALGDDRHIQKFEASFWQKSPYKGPPTPEVIEHWHHLTHTPALNLTREEMQRMGISTDSVQFPAEHGGGYLAYLESAHQLHCLEALWESHHYAHHPDLFPILTEKLTTLPKITEAHLEHCVDVLRQQLMCTASSGVVTFRWVEGISGPYPDFSSQGHVCRDYEALLGWAEGRRADQGFMDSYGWEVPESGVVKLKTVP